MFYENKAENFLRVHWHFEMKRKLSLVAYAWICFKPSCGPTMCCGWLLSNKRCFWVCSDGERWLMSCLSILLLQIHSGQTAPTFFFLYNKHKQLHFLNLKQNIKWKKLYLYKKIQANIYHKNSFTVTLCHRSVPLQTSSPTKKKCIFICFVCVNLLTFFCGFLLLALALFVISLNVFYYYFFFCLLFASQVHGHGKCECLQKIYAN